MRSSQKSLIHLNPSEMILSLVVPFNLYRLLRGPSRKDFLGFVGPHRPLDV